MRKHFLHVAAAIALGLGCLTGTATHAGEAAPDTRTGSLKVRLTFGHRDAQRTGRSVQLLAGTPGVVVSGLAAIGLEPDDRVGERTLLHAGAGDVDGLEFDVAWKTPIQPRRKPHETWAWLLQNTVPDAAQRLRDDPGLTPAAPVLTVQLADDGTRGFSIGLEQLARHKAMWLPEQDAFITLADAPIDFATHLSSLKGQRILDRVKREPEATLADFTGRWEDMGNPHAWSRPWETDWLGMRGHLIPVAGNHGTLYKFGIDRWGNVRPDMGSPHKFRFDLRWPGAAWTAQRLTDGLPVVVTNLTREGQRCQIEQFTAPRDRTPSKMRGEQPMAIFTRATISGTAGPVKLGFRLGTESKDRHVELREVDGRWHIADRQTGRIWLTIEPGPGLNVRPGKQTIDDNNPRVEFEVEGVLAAGETRQVVLKLPSPAAPPEALASVAALNFDAERAVTLKYWEDWLAQGARFEVPEPVVNELFLANLWHALRLPRFREQNGQARIDLPYSNFAYGQVNADWPINQAVYVSYMIHALRGHYAVAEEEFLAMFQTQQQADGRIAGYANWGVYSPSMLYSIGQHFLLSRDTASFERMLPQALKTMDWCLAQVAASRNSKQAPGLVLAPLNDLTHDARAWAFPQGYFVAGLRTFAQALAEYGHPRAAECRSAAERMFQDVERAFARGSVKSPVVQLADGTWINYVPCDALTPRRLLDVWYPTDVDCGPVHMARLAAIDPRGWLATAMLHDHEDNLFYNQWGAANEPVYNQQGTAYLHRDEPEAAIRTFYSMIACAFSHGQLEPVEHRWAWGQYFGPPSTDGAWFELYRNMLIRETEEGLFIGQAVPRPWLANGRSITVERAPTYYGPMNLRITSEAAADAIRAQVEFTTDRRPATLLVRLRHPQKKQMTGVTVNGQPWTAFDPQREWVRIPTLKAGRYAIVASYR